MEMTRTLVHCPFHSETHSCQREGKGLYIQYECEEYLIMKNATNTFLCMHEECLFYNVYQIYVSVY